MQVKDNSGERQTYAISETQFKWYAGDHCKLMTADEQARRDGHLSQSSQVHQQLLGHQRSVCLASDLQSRDQECTITF